jgi:peptidoglycan/xylan/chitin deacetylase (PgdA/CDA1 family)
MVVLCYHSISEANDPWCVPPGEFAWQVRWLARWFRPGTVTLTFDDGYADFADAWPPVRSYGLPAVVFAVSGALGGLADWEGANGLPLLSRGALRDLACQGVEVGAHSVTHARLSRLDAGRAREEMARSKAALEAVLGAPVHSFAYPYGEATPALARMADELGFARAFTMRSGRGGGQFWRRRVPVLRADGKVRFMLKALTAYASWLDLCMDLRGVPG